MSPTHLPAHPTDLGEEATLALCGARVAREALIMESASVDCLMCYEMHWSATALANEHKRVSAGHPLS